MTTPEENLRKLISVVEIEDVRMIEGSAKTTISGEEVTPSNLALKTASKVLGDFDPVTSSFRLRVAFNAQVIPQSPANAEPAIVFNVVHELTYRVPAGSVFSGETLTAFAKVNGVFNAWPYWREFVQSATAKMALPRLILPVFRGAPSVVDTSDEATSKAGSVSTSAQTSARHKQPTARKKR